MPQVTLTLWPREGPDVGYMANVGLTVLFTEAPEGGYVVTVPALREVVTEGDTLAEAKAAAEEAIVCALLTRRDLGERWPEDVPAPSPRPHVLVERLSPVFAVA
jgi:predicted RNase H-like HicB family nuclease